MNNLGEYISELTDSKGVSVVTVKDGWVFVFTKDFLQSLINEAKDAESDKVSVFVKTTKGVAKN